jgi:RNA polymerase sigma-70 factor (ECF subfamily)
MGATPHYSTEVMSPDAFRRFYRQHVPAVYGYLLHLCAGDRSRAEDLTQDTWMALVKQLQAGRAECADIRWLITVARSNFIDWARRDRRLRAKLQLVVAGQPTQDIDPAPHEVLDQLAGLQPMHRLVLVMRYVEDLPVPTIAAAIGRDVTATNSLLARARGELRRHAQEAHR